MKKINNYILGMLLLLMSSTAYSITLDFSPSSSNVTVGDTFDVELTISGLADFAVDSLGAFDIDVLFDSSVLGFNGIAYGDPILGDQLDPFNLGSLTATTPSAGSVNLFQVSFDLASDLNSLQVGSFTLATLTFDALAAGSSFLDFGAYTLSDAFGSALTATTLQGSANAAVASVPESSSLILMSFALFGLVALGKKRS